MINNNFKKILKCLFTNDNTDLNSLGLIGLDGEKIRMRSDGRHEILPYLNTSLNTIINSVGISPDVKVKGGVCIGFGSGSKQVSLEDYKLDDIIDNLSYQSSSVATTEDGYIVTTSLKNIFSTDITVSEVGLFCRGQDSNYQPSDPCMLIRNVLETPITIKPNEIKTFTITISF